MTADMLGKCDICEALTAALMKNQSFWVWRHIGGTSGLLWRWNGGSSSETSATLHSCTLCYISVDLNVVAYKEWNVIMLKCRTFSLMLTFISVLNMSHFACSVGPQGDDITYKRGPQYGIMNDTQLSPWYIFRSLTIARSSLYKCLSIENYFHCFYNYIDFWILFLLYW
jgi:hypothetical protein